MTVKINRMLKKASIREIKGAIFLSSEIRTICLKMGVQNSILVRLRIWRTGQHTSTKNFYEYL